MTTLITITQALEHLKAGKTIAYPTEAVYGLGCDPFDEHAVDYLLSLKGRRVEKGLILVAAHIEQIKALIAPLPEYAWKRLLDTWPGPITWVVPASAQVPAWIRGQHGSVALRVSTHPIIASLCTAFDKPLISTSANLQSQPAIKSPEEVEKVFDQKIAGIVAGELGTSTRPTEMRDILTNQVLRTSDTTKRF